MAKLKDHEKNSLRVISTLLICLMGAQKQNCWVGGRSKGMYALGLLILFLLIVLPSIN